MEMIYMNRNYIKEHPKARKTLRIIGFIVLPVGLALMIIADIFFFMGDTSLFFLNFIGAPFIFIGAVCLMYGFMKTVSSYVAGETTPVISGSANYIYEGIKNVDKKVCPNCNELNDTNSHFCKKCGTSLDAKCPNCGEIVSAEDTFCKNCGKKLR